MRKLYCVCVEGLDGCGKSTIAKLLVEELNGFGIPAIYTREPGGTPAAERIRKVILDDSEDEMDCLTEAYLFVASRNEHLKKTVLPALKEGKVVVLDRYFYSSLAYQGVARGLGFNEVFNINKPVIKNVIPEITFWLDVDAETAAARINGNNRNKNRLDRESLDFYKKVREGYRLCAKNFKEVVRVDASMDIEYVFKFVKKVIEASNTSDFAV